MIKQLLAFLMFSQIFIGQTPSEKELIISYCVGHYNFGKTGEFEKRENFKFVLEESFFVLKEFQSISNQYVYNSATKKNDYKVSDTVYQFPNKKLEKSVIENLIKQLSQNENNFNIDFINSKFSKEISKKEILKIARKQDKMNWFRDDSGKEKIRQIQSFQNFKKYIQDKNPNSNNVIVFSDTWNLAEIKYSGSNYKINFNNVFGQPIRINNLNEIVNLNVNLTLLEILPKKSLLAKETTIENIKTSYIDWFIKNTD